MNNASNFRQNLTRFPSTVRLFFLCLIASIAATACDSFDEGIIDTDRMDKITYDGIAYKSEDGSMLTRVGDYLYVRGVDGNPAVTISSAEDDPNDVVFRPVRIQKDGLFSIELTGRDGTGIEKTLARFEHRGITDRSKQLDADFSGLLPGSVTVEFLDNGHPVFQKENIPLDDETGYSLPIGKTAGEPTSFHYIYEVDEHGNVIKIIVLDYEDEGGQKQGLPTGYANVELAFGKGETIKCTHIRFIPHAISSRLLSFTGIRMNGSDVSDFAFLME